MRVFVTGGTGFIGRHVMVALTKRGHHVLALTRDSFQAKAATDKLQAICGDLSAIGEIESSLRDWRPDVCIHLAWYAEPGKYLHSSVNPRFVQWSQALLELLAQVSCRHVVMAGTCAEYDSDIGYLREESPTRPETLYAASKLSLYLTGYQLAKQYGIRFAWGRIFYPYGPGEDSRRAVPAAICALLRKERFKTTEGAQVRDYLHVADIADGFVTIAESEAESCFNISSGSPVAMRTLMETIGEFTASSELIEFGAIPYREWDPMFICGDNRRLRSLGWRPRHTLRAGLESTIAWWQANIGSS